MTAKERLRAYRDMKREVSNQHSRLEELQTQIDRVSPVPYDGFPRSGGGGYADKLPALLDKKDGILARLREAEEQRLTELTVIENAINAVDGQAKDSIYREILRLHYLDGLNWEKIGEEVGYERRSVLYYHSVALQKISAFL
jgi:DNA-directed RNA polymerase specialized sigma24 family protein